MTANYIVVILDGTKNLLPSDRSEKAVIAVLLGAVNAIGQYLNDVEPDLLKGPLGFEAPSLNPLENQDEQKQQEERLKNETAMKKGAAYLLVNQILFYNVLSPLTFKKKMENIALCWRLLLFMQDIVNVLENFY